MKKCITVLLLIFAGSIIGLLIMNYQLSQQIKVLSESIQSYKEEPQNKEQELSLIAYSRLHIQELFDEYEFHEALVTLELIPVYLTESEDFQFFAVMDDGFVVEADKTYSEKGILKGEIRVGVEKCVFSYYVTVRDGNGNLATQCIANAEDDAEEACRPEILLELPKLKAPEVLDYRVDNENCYITIGLDTSMYPNSRFSIECGLFQDGVMQTEYMEKDTNRYSDDYYRAAFEFPAEWIETENGIYFICYITDNLEQTVHRRTESNYIYDKDTESLRQVFIE